MSHRALRLIPYTKASCSSCGVSSCNSAIADKLISPVWSVMSFCFVPCLSQRCAYTFIVFDPCRGSHGPFCAPQASKCSTKHRYGRRQGAKEGEGVPVCSELSLQDALEGSDQSLWQEDISEPLHWKTWL